MKKTLLFTFLLPAGLVLTAQAQNVFIDFGSGATLNTSGGNWNDITGFADLATVVDLVDFDTGLDSGIKLQVTDAFGGTNTTGRTNTSIGDFVETVVEDSFFTSTEGGGDGTGAITFSGLTPGTAYEFIFVATRVTDDDRLTLYTLTGADVSTTIVNPSNNGSGTGIITSVYSDASGNVVLSVEKNEGSPSAFSYLGGLQIVAIPEPRSFAAFLGCVAMGGTLICRRKYKSKVGI